MIRHFRHIIVMWLVELAFWIIPKDDEPGKLFMEFAGCWASANAEILGRETRTGG
jgi:hypothetical protein